MVNPGDNEPTHTRIEMRQIRATFGFGEIKMTNSYIVRNCMDHYRAQRLLGLRVSLQA